MWGDTEQLLLKRSEVAEQDPAAACLRLLAGCLAFPGTVTVSPEVLIDVQAAPRYVLLTSTVQDLLRSERMQNPPATLRIMRRYRNNLSPIESEKTADVLRAAQRRGSSHLVRFPGLFLIFGIAILTAQGLPEFEIATVMTSPPPSGDKVTETGH